MSPKSKPPRNGNSAQSEQDLIAQLVEFLHSEDAINLQNELNTFNPFNVLRVGEYEIRHTNTLAWLLNPRQNHGLGDSFLRAFVACLPASESSRELSHRFEASTYVPTVMREVKLKDKGRLDLLITDRETWAIAIEAKVYSGQGKDQLERYGAALHGYNFGAWGEKKITVTKLFLTIEGEAPSDNNCDPSSESNFWLPITWANNICEPLSRTIKPFLNNPGELSPALQFARQYLNILNQVASGTNEVGILTEKLARRYAGRLRKIRRSASAGGAGLRVILNRHNELVEKVIAAGGSSVSGRAAIVRPLLEDLGFYVSDSGDSYIPFIPKEWNENGDIKKFLAGGKKSDPLLVRLLVWNRSEEIGVKLEIRDLGDHASDEMAPFRREVAELVAERVNDEKFPGAFVKEAGKSYGKAPRFFSIYSDCQKINKGAKKADIEAALNGLLERLERAKTVSAFWEIINEAITDSRPTESLGGVTEVHAPAPAQKR